MPETSEKKPVHQGWKTYATAGLLVLQALALALGWTEIGAMTGAGFVVNAAALGVFLRAGLKKLEKLIEEKTGWDIPDEILDKLASLAAEKAAEKASEILGKPEGQPPA